MDTWQEWRQRAKVWKKDHGVSDADIAAGVGRKRATVSSWFNKREPNLADFMATCSAMKADAAEILFGVKAPVAEEPPSPELSTEARDVALAWMRLTPARQHAIREWVFLESVLAQHYPWLLPGRPTGQSYNDYEKSVEGDLVRITKRMMMQQDPDPK